MKSAIDIKSPDWWLCFAILFTMVAALAGVTAGFYATIVISIIRIAVAAFSEGITSEATMMRFYYGGFIIVAFYVWHNMPFIWWIMFIATAIYTLIDKYLVDRLLVWLE